MATATHTPINHQVRLASRPTGAVTADNWQFTEEPAADAGPGGVLVKTLALSLDPAMRGWLNEGKSYIPPVAIGEVMRAGGVGVVVASHNPGFAVGDHVSAGLGVQDYWAVPADQVQKSGIAKIDLRAGTLTQWLNVLGMPGMTGYFGLMDVGQPKAGETLVVSGAAGRGRPDRRAAGEDQGLPRRRHRRRSRQVRVGGEGIGLRRLASTTKPLRLKARRSRTAGTPSAKA